MLDLFAHRVYFLALYVHDREYISKVRKMYQKQCYVGRHSSDL